MGRTVEGSPGCQSLRGALGGVGCVFQSSHFRAPLSWVHRSALWASHWFRILVAITRRGCRRVTTYILVFQGFCLIGHDFICC